eukprot:521132_1
MQNFPFETMCSSRLIVISTLFLHIPSIECSSELLLLDSDPLSLFIHAETQMSFIDTIGNDLNPNIEWCLFYNRNDISNHLYCGSTASSPFITECHSMKDEHYTFTNASLCDAHTSPLIPIVGTFTEQYICHLYTHLCCNLKTHQCIQHNANHDISTTDVPFILPFTDGFLEFTLDTTLSISCISTNRNLPKCDQMPSLSTPHEMLLVDALLVSANSLLILWTDSSDSIILIHRCTIFTVNAQCTQLSHINIPMSDGTDQQVSVIHHDECILLLSVTTHATSYILIYNYCTDETHDQIDTSHLTSYHVLNDYQHFHRDYASDMTCFILHTESEWVIQCLSMEVQSTATTTTATQTIDKSPQIHRNDIHTSPNNAKLTDNGFWPYGDASFITVIVAGGLVIIACLICSVICYSKYHKEKVRKEWYKARELNKKNKSKATKPRIDYSESDMESKYSRYAYSASYPRRATRKRHFELEIQPPPPPPMDPPPMHPQRQRRTSITHRTLPDDIDEEEGQILDAEITPFASNKCDKPFAFTYTVDYLYDGELSVSSDTLEYNLQTASYVLPRTSQSLADDGNESILSKCTVDGMDAEEDEKKYAAAPIPQYIPYTSELTKQLQFRKRPRITRRCKDDEEYWRCREDDTDAMDKQAIKYQLIHLEREREHKWCESSHSDIMTPLEL